MTSSEERKALSDADIAQLREQLDAGSADAINRLVELLMPLDPRMGELLPSLHRYARKAAASGEREYGQAIYALSQAAREYEEVDPGIFHDAIALYPNSNEQEMAESGLKWLAARRSSPPAKAPASEATAPTLLWSVGAFYGIYPSVAINAGVVYGVALNDGVIGVDLETGAERWRVGVKDAPYAPTVTDDTVYFVTARKELIAASRADAKVRWRLPLTVAVFQAPTIAGGLVLVRSNKGQLLAFDQATGAVRWECSYPGTYLDLVRPLVLGERVVVPHDKGLAVVALSSGEVLKEVAHGKVNQLLDDGEALYSFAVGYNDFYVHDRETCEVIRRFKLDGELGSNAVSQNTVAVNGVLVSVSGADNRTRQVDTRSASPRLVDAGGISMGPPAVKGNLVYLTPSGGLTAFDLAKNAVVWTQEIPSYGALSAPLFANDLIVVASEGNVVALRES